MKKTSFLGLLLFLVLTTAARAADREILPTAVFDFESRDETTHGMGPKLSALVSALLSADPNIILVERAELEKVLGEQEMGLSGTVGSETAAKVGHLTGAKVLITGLVFRQDKDLMIVAKIIGTETTRTFGEIVQGPASKSLADFAAEVAKKISKTIQEKGDSLAAKTVSKEDRIDKLVKGLKEGKRPSVSVSLPESHFGTRVIDPAAETELSKILQKAGFTVVDEKSEQKPDIEITGQAFSAYGLRKGNLISCRSRVELKAQERVGGKILAKDSQTSVAVDIAEQTAAKTALENAALDLAERLVPLLAK